MNVEKQQERVNQLKAASQQLIANHSSLMGRIAEAEEYLALLKEESEKVVNSVENVVDDVKKSLESSNDASDSSTEPTAA